MKLESDSFVVVALDFGQTGSVAFDGRQPCGALAATPMISPLHRQHHISKGELRFGEVASHEVGALRSERFAEQLLPGKKQAGAAVHQQARCLGGWNTLGSAMAAPGEKALAAPKPPMPRDQIVIEHANRAAP